MIVLRRETLPLFYDMMEKEMKNSGSIKKVNEIFSDNSGMKNAAEALRPRLVQ